MSALATLFLSMTKNWSQNINIFSIFNLIVDRKGLKEVPTCTDVVH